MKLGFATTFDSADVSNWSGTPYYMSQAFAGENVEVVRFGNFERKLPAFFKVKQFWKKIACDQRESPRFNIHVAQAYSKQLMSRLETHPVDAIIAPQIHPICYLETKKPLALWTDGLYASLIGFYPGFSSHSASSIAQGNTITRECLDRCDLAIFSSDWAARTALEIYGTQKSKVHVVPFGANLIDPPTLEDVENFLKQRSRKTITFLFLGKHWDRKDGETVFNVIKALHARGQSVECHFVGCYPPKDVEIPAYIYCHGFISKRTPDGVAKIKKLLSSSHFLFVPSRAEAYGIVFCEANAYGLPCLTSHVGGISTIVKDNLNGMTFGLDASVDQYCDYILNLMSDYNRYEEMALASFHEFETRLNWTIATRKVKRLLAGL